MRFLVPQFIDVEPKVFGPVTVRQFIVCIVGVMVMFVTYKLSDFSLFLLLGILEFMLFGTIAFLKINGQPFHFFFLNVVQTFKKPTARIWMKQDVEIREEKEGEKEPEEEFAYRRELPSSRLSEISMIVNTGGAYKEEE